ncbi:hypothetical protein ACFFS4_42945 [Kutzneria kofuensis]|uniref:Uncharacterized protein n=1 Tax=Kutzneria kofuensis TaxID=103725 RepID=A0A7W9KF18_9PSEU|nr:hypothetical protein [Kutzneria kofuensis]MBB5891435.1 hypothetical protein [Kutzneria kofuensis]
MPADIGGSPIAAMFSLALVRYAMVAEAPLDGSRTLTVWALALRLLTTSVQLPSSDVAVTCTPLGAPVTG